MCTIAMIHILVKESALTLIIWEVTIRIYIVHFSQSAVNPIVRTRVAP